MRDILNTYNLTELRKIASSYNRKVKISGVWKMGKAQLIEELMKFEEHIKDIKPKEKVKRQLTEKQKEVLKERLRKGRETIKKKREEKKKAVEKPKMSAYKYIQDDDDDDDYELKKDYLNIKNIFEPLNYYINNKDKKNKDILELKKALHGDLNNLLIIQRLMLLDMKKVIDIIDEKINYNDLKKNYPSKDTIKEILDYIIKEIDERINNYFKDKIIFSTDELTKIRSIMPGVNQSMTKTKITELYNKYNKYVEEYKKTGKIGKEEPEKKIRKYERVEKIGIEDIMGYKPEFKKEKPTKKEPEEKIYNFNQLKGLISMARTIKEIEKIQKDIADDIIKINISPVQARKIRAIMEEKFNRIIEGDDDDDEKYKTVRVDLSKGAKSIKEQAREAFGKKGIDKIGDDLDKFLSYLKSDSKRNFNRLKDAGYSGYDIDNVFANKKLADFFPTPEMCIEECEEEIKEAKNILDGTCGLGFPLYYMRKINKNANITGIEYNLTTSKVAQKIFKGSNIEVKRGDFFEVPIDNNYDHIFLNPPFTSGYSKQDKYFLKFLFYLFMMFDANDKLKYRTAQVIFPANFIEEMGYKEGDNIELNELIAKYPHTQIKKYFNELGIYKMYGFKKSDDIEEILEHICPISNEFLGFCKFETTNFKIANILITHKSS